MSPQTPHRLVNRADGATAPGFSHGGGFPQ